MLAGFSEPMLDDSGEEVIFVQPHVQPIFVPESDDDGEAQAGKR